LLIEGSGFGSRAFDNVNRVYAMVAGTPTVSRASVLQTVTSVGGCVAGAWLEIATNDASFRKDYIQLPGCIEENATFSGSNSQPRRKGVLGG